MVLCRTTYVHTYVGKAGTYNIKWFVYLPLFCVGLVEPLKPGQAKVAIENEVFFSEMCPVCSLEELWACLLTEKS